MDFSGAGTGRGTIVRSSAAVFLVEHFNGFNGRRPPGARLTFRT
jgi:hypothetical protein